jgi:DNA-binding transcriptional ArsR family regulator
MDGTNLDPRRLGALAHPMRLQILEAAESEAVSPSEVAVALRQPLGVVAYHFRVLHTAGLIELVATEPRRGSVQSFYQTTARGWADLVATLESIVGDRET